MTANRLCQAILGVALGMSATHAQAPVKLDGQYLPPRVEANYSFHCRESRTTVRYAQERRPLDSVGGDPERALVVTLLDLAVTGRDISHRDRKAVEALFRGLAWVEDVSAECFDDTVTVAVRGMPLRAWAEFVTEKRDQRPRSPVRTIHVGPKGKVTIR